MILTIDEAIRYCEETIEQTREDIENAEAGGIPVNYATCDKYIDSHRQLADWLKELKELREKVNCLEKPNSSDDLIRRRDAIDAMCSVCGNDCDKSKFVYDAPQWEQVILCPEHYALSVLPSVQPESQWIPCSKRLPEPRVDVWVNSDIGQIQGYYEENIGIWYASFGQGRDYLELIVNAWMPLPEPYGGEQ